jgi:hypothetical protein
VSRVNFTTSNFVQHFPVILSDQQTSGILQIPGRVQKQPSK